MFFRNELNLALKKISELETEINNLKKDTVSRKEFSVLQNKLSKAEETIKKLSKKKTDAINKTKADKTEVDVQQDKSKIAVSDKELSIKTNETETKKTVSVKDFAAKNKKADCSIFKYADYKDGIEIIQYIGLNRTKVDIPEYIDNKPVIRIGNNAFEGTNEITDVFFPEMLKEIGKYAFLSSGIRKFIPKNELELIEHGAFAYCKQLKEVVMVSEKVKFFSAEAFYRCENLSSVRLPCNLEVIDSYAFCECKNLSSVSFSCKLEEIKSYAFYHCNNLKSITFPATLKRIEENNFGWSSVLKMVFPEKLQYLGACNVPNSAKQIAFLSPDTEIIDVLMKVDTAYCIPGGKTYDSLRRHGTTIKPLEEFPE